MKYFFWKLKRSIQWFLFVWRLPVWEDCYDEVLITHKYHIQRNIDYCKKYWKGKQMTKEIAEMEEYVKLIDIAQRWNLETYQEDWDKMCDYFKTNAQSWWI